MATLTPIKVRGKKRAAPKSSTAPVPGDDPTAAVALTSAKKDIAGALRRKKARGSPIMRMPNEILEIIFLYSQNTALPLASPVLNMRLSSPHTRLLATVAAFAETWDDFFGVPRGPPLVPKPPPGPNARFQSQIMAQPWITVDFLCQAQDFWYDRCGEGRTYSHIDEKVRLPHYCKAGYDFGERSPPLCSHAKFDAAAVMPPPGTQAPQSEPGANPIAGFSARRCFEFDFQRFKYYVEDSCRLPIAAETFEASMTEVADGFCMPRRLLPCEADDPERVRLVFWLYRAGAFGRPDCIDWQKVLVTYLEDKGQWAAEQLLGHIRVLPAYYVHFLVTDAMAKFGYDF